MTVACCFSVFQDLSDQPRRVQFNRPTLIDEIRVAKSFDGSPEYGEFLYSRPLNRKIITSERYILSVDGVHLKYQHHTEEPGMAPFDYYNINGPIYINHLVQLSKLKVQASVCIRLTMDFLDSAKFKRFCSKYYFSFEVEDGGVTMYGYETATSSGPSIQIPVQYEVLCEV